LGQLQQKWLHSEDGIHFRRRTTYTNNIRGWLTQGQTFYKSKENEPDSSFYNFGLGYANGNNYTNGNISQMQWSGKAENVFTKGLAFTYDGANRLLGSTGLNNYKEIESGISYDKNGNIKTLVRSGAVLDNLGYAYLGNRLSAVTDGSGSNLGVKNGVSNYGYDGNGNMTSDGNRGATLTYNYLNLPKTVTIGGKTLTYDYDAAGTKHKYVADTLIVKYAGDFEYNQSNVFKRLAISEGQAVYRKDTIRFDYFLKDHLGNVRVVFDEKGRILQRTDYYPFGLSVNRDGAAPKVQNWINRYLYNEKELQVGSGYLDYGARMYMPEVGRWGVVDPMVEKNNDQSGYSYAVNNPILYTDPFGLDTSSANANKLVHQGDVILFDEGGSATQSVNEATVSGQRNNDQSASVTMLLPGAFFPIFGPGSIPTTMPRALPLLIPAGYAGVDAYLRGPSVIEDIAQLLERLGVPSEVLRGPEVRQSQQRDRNWRDDKLLSPGEINKLKKKGWDHSDKKGRGGQRDLYKDKDGNVYEKPKGGNGPGESIDYNLKNF
jgi:RHS repeat-associated protein